MRRQAFAAVLACLAGTALLLAAAAADIQVTPLVADGQVTASFTAPATFTEDARAVVRSGLLLTFTFTVELRRPSSIWLDRTLGTVTMASSVKFDNLTGSYQVSKSRDSHVVWSERTQDDQQARDWMTTFERVALASDERLEPKAEYYLRVRMQASPKRTFSLWPWGGDDGSGRANFTVSQ